MKYPPVDGIVVFTLRQNIFRVPEPSSFNNKVGGYALIARSNKTGILSLMANRMKSARRRSTLLRKIPVGHIEVFIALLAGINTYFILEFGEHLVSFFQHSFLVLIEKVCVIAGIAGILIHTKYFNEILEKKFTVRNQIVITLIFGVISIFGTYSGLRVFGAIVNVRDLAPMVAGLIGGPTMGACTGLIGGIHRYTLGGSTAFPCALATIIAGLLGGMVYVLNNRQFISVFGAVLLSIAMELVHMALALLLTSPPSYAVTIVRTVVFPVTVSNALGMLAFALIISGHLKKTGRLFEKTTDEEMQTYQFLTAGTIHKRFLADEVPSLKGIDTAAVTIPEKIATPCFYYIAKISDNKLALSVADISEQGFKASVEIAVLHTILRIKSMEGRDAEHVIQFLNRRFSNRSDIKLLYGIIDGEKRTFKYVNAGLGAPALFSQHGIIKLERLFDLGTMNEHDIIGHEIVLSSGDVILIHTDGAMNTETSTAWHERLWPLLQRSSSDTAEKLVSEIRDTDICACTGNGEHGCMTIVLLKVVDDR